MNMKKIASEHGDTILALCVLDGLQDLSSFIRDLALENGPRTQKETAMLIHDKLCDIFVKEETSNETTETENG